MARIAGIIEKIDTALALPDIFTRDPKQARALSKARRRRRKRAAARRGSWLQASSQYDEAAG